MKFGEKTVVVTGGTRGIGRAISILFAREGACVFAGYLSNEEAAAAVEAEGATLPGSITAIRADVSTGEGATRLVETAAAATGTIDVLVNNAGIIRDCFLPMMSDADWDAVMRSNIDPLFHCCKWGTRKMLSRKKGAIVNISSIAAFTGTPGQTNYAATKGAIISFTKALAREMGPMGIRVNAVAPGLVDTEMLAGMKQDMVEKVVKSTALGRIGRAEEVAEAVLFLASDRASYITGHCLVVDGGVV